MAGHLPVRWLGQAARVDISPSLKSDAKGHTHYHRLTYICVSRGSCIGFANDAVRRRIITCVSHACRGVPTSRTRKSHTGSLRRLGRRSFPLQQPPRSRLCPPKDPILLLNGDSEHDYSRSSYRWPCVPGTTRCLSSSYTGDIKWWPLPVSSNRSSSVNARVPC